MAGVVVVGWRYRGVVANSHEHWLSSPVYMWQLSFVELVATNDGDVGVAHVVYSRRGALSAQHRPTALRHSDDG